MTDTLAFIVGVVIVLACAIDWNDHPETYTHPDNYPEFVQ